MNPSKKETIPMPTGKRKVLRPPMLTLSKCASVTFRTPDKPSRIEEETSSGIMWSVAARRGRRKTNREDMYSVLPFVHEGFNSEPISLFAIFDGHGGQRVAKLASSRLPELFLRAYEESGDVTYALNYAFGTTDQEVISKSARSSSEGKGHETAAFSRRPSGSELGSVTLQRGFSNSGGTAVFARVKSRIHKMPDERREVRDVSAYHTDVETPSAPRALHRGSSSRGVFKRSKSRADESLSTVPVKSTRACGTTATFVAIVGEQFFIAHVGDSRAVLSNRGGITTRLCEDHKPGREDELERIEAAGGLVIQVSGTHRVNGVLAVSRAIGDVELKDYVISEPEIKTFPLSGEEEFLILASDGLWDVISDSESVDLVRNSLLKDSGNDGSEESAAKLLVQSAWDRGSKDDVSVIVVNLLTYAELYKTYGDGFEDDGPMEEVVEEVDIEKLSLLVGDSNELKLEMVTPMAYPSETPRVSRKSPW